MERSVELVADRACALGETPVWHPDERRVYWADLRARRLFSYDPRRETDVLAHDGELVGGMVIEADGAFLLCTIAGAIKRWDGERLCTVARLPGEEGSRCNDAIADPAGRLFVGTMDRDGSGRLHRVDPDGQCTVVRARVEISNGMGLTADRRRLYHTESGRGEILAFAYDPGSGALGDPRVFARVPPGQGVPDGLAVDAADHVWSARWGGGCVVRYDPDGRLVDQIALPVPKVSSLAFGPDGDLYVTTAGGDDRANEGALAGALFRIRVGIGGAERFRSRIGVTAP